MSPKDMPRRRRGTYTTVSPDVPRVPVPVRPSPRNAARRRAMRNGWTR